MNPFANASALLLVAILAHVFLWAMNTAMANHRSVSPSHWDLSSKEYIGPTGNNHAVYQSEFDWFGRRPHEWYESDPEKGYPESEVR